MGIVSRAFAGLLFFEIDTYYYNALLCLMPIK